MAVHCVVQAAEPNGPVRVARTYFFSMSPHLCTHLCLAPSTAMDHCDATSLHGRNILDAFRWC